MVAPAGKVMFMRGMPADLVREVKARAARRGQTLTTFVAEALARSVGVESVGAADELEPDMAWYAAEQAKLARQYGGEHIAIVDRAVVDHARDFDVLARRVFAKYGHRSIFMPRVAEQVVAEARIRSPRRVAR